MAVGLKVRQARSAQDVGEADALQIQAVGGLRRQGAAGGDGIAPALPAAQVGRRARTQQQGLRVGLRCLLEEGAELPAAGVALAAGSRARLPVGLAKPATLAIKSAQHGELEAEVPIWFELLQFPGIQFPGFSVHHVFVGGDIQLIVIEAAGRVNSPVGVQAGSLVLHAPVACAAHQRAVPEVLCCLQAVIRN